MNKNIYVRVFVCVRVNASVIKVVLLCKHSCTTCGNNC